MNRASSLSAGRVLTAILLCAACQGAHAQQAAAEAPITRIPLLKEVLPAGDYRSVQAAIVELAPGAGAPRHRHDVALVVYVLDGVVENRFNDGAPVTHRRGDSWWEAPGTVHNVIRNLSGTERARLLVVYIGEEGKAATVPLE